MPDPPFTPPVHIRKLQTSTEYEACVRLQRETWGDRFPDLVPPSILHVTQRIGGLVIGAFDHDGRMVGFAFALAGFTDGERILWSDMLAVRPGQRGAGIGTQLKKFQRGEALKENISRIFWTFDPLVSRNASLNLIRLGARIDSYVPDMYAEGEGEVHRGLGMDRFVAVWDLKSPEVEACMAGRPLPAAPWPPDVPVVNSRLGESGEIVPVHGTLPDAPRVLVEIPADIHGVRDRSIAQARLWRTSTRKAFLHYLPRGYHVEAFVCGPGGHMYYLLAS